MHNIHSCSKEVKATAYTTLVRPSFEYASAVWEPFNKNQISQLDYNEELHDDDHDWITFKTRISYINNLQLKMRIPWTKARSVLMYKILHNLVEIHAEHLLIPSDSRTRGMTAFRAIYTRADVYRFSFFRHTMITWNSIPPAVRPASTICQFQAALGSITFPVQSQIYSAIAPHCL
jgi:hypothetical protein